MTPVEFDAGATCPRWLRFLDEVFGGDADLIEFIQRSAGYCLTGVTTEQVLWLMHGSGANGKDVFQGTLRAMLGDLAFNSPFSTFELNARPSIPNDVAALLGRRLVTAAETLEGTRLNEARVKALTGSTVMTARFLHAEYFQFEPLAKYWLALNHLPVVKNDSYAFWRRIRLIPFNRQFKEDADPHLLDTLAGELPGILTWALEGCLRWQMGGLRPPAIVTAATEEYQRDSDPLAEFLADRCVFHPQHRVQAGRFYTAYRTWAQEQGLPDKETLGSKTFGQRAQGRFRRGPHTRDGYWYFGVGLAADGLVDGENVTGEGVL
jgi:putative DNA primase/helicase